MGITFSTNDIRGRADDTLTTEHAWSVGKALAEWLPEQGSVVVAKSETANTGIVRGLVEGLLLQGRNVVDAGVGDWQVAVNALSTADTVGGAHVTHDDIQNLEIITLLDASGVVIDAEKGLMEISALVVDSDNFLPAARKGEIKTVTPQG